MMRLLFVICFLHSLYARGFATEWPCFSFHDPFSVSFILGVLLPNDFVFPSMNPSQFLLFSGFCYRVTFIFPSSLYNLSIRIISLRFTCSFLSQHAFSYITKTFHDFYTRSWQQVQHFGKSNWIASFTKSSIFWLIKS